MSLFQGKLAVVPGYTKFHPDDLGGDGIMLIDEFPLETGTTHLLVYTTAKIYRYIIGTDSFEDKTRTSGGDYIGGLDEFWSADIFPHPSGTDLLYVCTNHHADPVQKWDGNVVGAFQNLGGGPHFCAALAQFQNLCVMLNLVEGGIEKPRKIKWSDNGAVETWGSGLAGNLTLFQGADHGVSLEPLSDFLAAYRERSIHLLTFVGAPFVITQRQIVSGVGLPAKRALLNLDNKHVFLGNDNVYIFNGVDLEAIGEQIRDVLFDIVDPEFMNRSLIMLDEPRNDMYLIVPTVSSGGIPDTWFVWNLTTNMWSGPINGRQITGGGPFQKRTSDIWALAFGPWTLDTGKWKSGALLASFPTNLFGNTQSIVFEIDPTINTADGAPVTGRFESAAYQPGLGLQPPVMEATCQEIEPLIAGNTPQQINWYVGTSESPTGPYTWFGPFVQGPRGFVATRTPSARWFKIAAETSSSTGVIGLIVTFEGTGS